MTVILGSGIIGLSTAYYLATAAEPPPDGIHLVDPAPRLFSSASGFAAGFLARDWHRPAVSSLAALSFAEHERLAGRHDGAQRWGFARTCALSYEMGGDAAAPAVDPAAAGGDGDAGGGDEGRPARKRGEDWLLEGTSRALASAAEGRRDGDAEVPPWWRRRRGDAASVVDEGTAIVDPLELCRFLLSECHARGVHVHHPASAESLVLTDGILSGVRIRYADARPTTTIPTTHLLLAAGSWTPRVFRTLFPASRTAIPVTSLAGHSLVVRTPRGKHGPDPRATHAVFCAVKDFSPEIFSRPSGVIYVAGLNSSSLPLPEPDGGPAVPVECDLRTLRRVARELINTDEDDHIHDERRDGARGGDDIGGGSAGGLEILREALCFRPVTGKGTPLLGRIADYHLGGVRTAQGGRGGVFVAVGHGPWGISLSLGTGKVMAEMMLSLPLSADVDALGLDVYGSVSKL